MTPAVVFMVIVALIAAGVAIHAARGTIRNIRAEFAAPPWETVAGVTYCGTCGDKVPTPNIPLHFLVEHTDDDQLPQERP